MGIRSLSLKILFLSILALLPFLIPSGSLETFFEDSKMFPTRYYLFDINKEEGEKEEPLDFLFLGGSTMQNSILPYIIENHIKVTSPQFDTFNASMGSADAYTLYATLQHYVKHRKVKVVFLSSEALLMELSPITVLNFNKAEIYPSWSWMTPIERLRFLGMAVHHAPLRLKNLILPTQRDYTVIAQDRMNEYRRLRGARLFYESYENIEGLEIRPYKIPVLTIADVVTTIATKQEIAKKSYIHYFARKIQTLCRDHDIKLYLLQSPRFEDQHIPQDFKSFQMDVISVAHEKLFPGMTSEEKLYFFRDFSHLNAVGGRMFTEALLPVFEQIHKETM